MKNIIIGLVICLSASASFAGDHEVASIQSLFSGKCLDISNGDQSEGTPLIQWDCKGSANQTFIFDEMGDGTFNIIAKNSGLCLDVPNGVQDNAVQIQQWACNGGDNQRFYVQRDDYGNVEIKIKSSQKCFDVYNGDGQQALESGTGLDQYECNQGQNQSFIIRYISE